MTASAIYEGVVRHRRFAEHAHEFSYPLAMFYLDLDELPTLLGGRLTRRGAHLVRFERGDYFGARELDLADAVRARVAEQTGSAPVGPIRLLTQLRSFGHCFNPVSFYYCFDRGCERLTAVLAEVTNTPWGERHGYVLAPAADSPESGEPLVGAGEKQLHVSPFMGMDHKYAWQLELPGQTLGVEISSSRDGEVAFDATLRMRRKLLTSAAVNRVTARYPAGTLRTLALIYSQALRLRLKGVHVRAHPGAAR